MASPSTIDIEAQARPEEEKDRSPAKKEFNSEEVAPPSPLQVDPLPRNDARKRGLKDRDEVWTDYLSESQRRDNEMLEACDKNMDVLLIFAGLFSSVLTAFTVNSYGQLQPDPLDRTNAILETIASQLSASAAGSSLNLAIPNYPQVTFTASRSMVRLNVYWFSSLTFSLLAALGAVLAKQWIVEYPRGAAPSATPCERAQNRQIRFAGITTWHFLAVIDFLSSLIQMAFLLFFIGLCEFLFSLNIIVGCAVATLCALGCLFIIFSHVAAIVDPSCPFRTPLSTSISNVCHTVGRISAKLIFGPVGERYNLWYHPTGWRSYIIRGWKKLRYGDSERVGDIPSWAASTATLAEDERLNIINAQALAWLLQWVADEDVVVAISSLIPTLPASDIRIPLADALPRMCALFQSYFVMDGNMDTLCPKIVPRDGQGERIKILGRAVHRIMLGYPNTSSATRATRVIGDIFGDAFLVFPPRDVPEDVHALVCCIFTADPYYHRRYSQAVQERLFVSLLENYAVSPWAIAMILDSLCIYISTGTQHPLHLSLKFKMSLLSHLERILRQAFRMVELTSAVGVTMNVILGGTLSPGSLLLDKAEALPRNLLTAIGTVTEELQTHPPSHADPPLLENCLSALLQVFQGFAVDGDMKASFLVIRHEALTLMCRLLLKEYQWSPTTVKVGLTDFPTTSREKA